MFLLTHGPLDKSIGKADPVSRTDQLGKVNWYKISGIDSKVWTIYPMDWIKDLL